MYRIHVCPIRSSTRTKCLENIDIADKISKGTSYLRTKYVSLKTSETQQTYLSIRGYVGGGVLTPEEARGGGELSVEISVDNGI